MIFIYVLSTLLIVGFVLAALMPERARWLLESLGWWEKVQAIDGAMMQRWMRWLGQFLILMALILAISVIAGYHPKIWFVPAVQAFFFGSILWWLGKPARHKSQQ